MQSKLCVAAIVFQHYDLMTRPVVTVGLAIGIVLRQPPEERHSVSQLDSAYVATSSGRR